MRSARAARVARRRPAPDDPSGANGASSSSDHGIQVGVGYTLGDLFFYANFEQLKYQTDGLSGPIVDEYKRNAWSIAGKWNVATGYIGAQFIQAQNATCDMADGSSCNADNTGGRMVGLGYYHTLSKQTQAYVMGTYIKNDSLQSYFPPAAARRSAQAFQSV